MADPSPAGPSLPPSQATLLLTSFTTFLTITLHTLLYHRSLYPPTTFLTSRAYNLPVHQSRHPGLCRWIGDAVTAVAAQLQEGRVRRIALVMHAPKSLAVLERWVFDVADFPVWGEDVGRGDAEEDGVNWTDVNEALRGALRRIGYAAEGMAALPEGSTFTLAVELRDDAPAPIGHPQPWIPSQPNLQPPTTKFPNQGSSLGGETTTPIRSVQAGPLFFECWVENGPPPPSESTSQETTSS